MDADHNPRLVIASAQFQPESFFSFRIVFNLILLLNHRAHCTVEHNNFLLKHIKSMRALGLIYFIIILDIDAATLNYLID